MNKAKEANKLSAQAQQAIEEARKCFSKERADEFERLILEFWNSKSDTLWEWKLEERGWVRRDGTN